jgi:hypothetical protein
MLRVDKKKLKARHLVNGAILWVRIRGGRITVAATCGFGSRRPLWTGFKAKSGDRQVKLMA